MLEQVVAVFGTLSPWVQIPLVLGLAVVVATVLRMGVYATLHRSKRLSKRGYDQVIGEEVGLPLYVSVLLVGVYVSVELLPEAPVDEAPGLPLAFVATASALSAVLVLWARAIVRVGNRAISGTDDDPTDVAVAPIFKNVLTFFVLVGTFVALLGVWRVDVTPLLASAGILGIIIGIAAQDSLGNFFGGLSLHFDKTYQVGDMIELESGERGTVVDMSIRSTTVLTRDNIAITVPNAVMNSTQVINESAPIRRRRIRVNVGVAYGSDLETVERAILEAAAAENVVLASPRPKVRFREFADSAIVAQLQCHINHPAQRGEAIDRLVRRIDERFAEAGVKIPFPQRELTFFESGNEISLANRPQAAGERDADNESDAEYEPDTAYEYPIPDGVERGE